MHGSLRYAARAARLLPAGSVPGRAFTHESGRASTLSGPLRPPTGRIWPASSNLGMANLAPLNTLRAFGIDCGDSRECLTGIVSGSRQDAGTQGRGHTRPVVVSASRGPSMAPWAHQSAKASAMACQQPTHRTKRLLMPLAISDASTLAQTKGDSVRAISSDSDAAEALPDQPASSRDIPQISTNVYLFHEDVISAMELSCYAIPGTHEPRWGSKLPYEAAVALRVKFKHPFVYDRTRHIIASMSPRSQPLPESLEVEVRKGVSWKVVRVSPAEMLAASRREELAVQPGNPEEGEEPGRTRGAEEMTSGEEGLQEWCSTETKAKLLMQYLRQVVRRTGKEVLVERLPAGGELVTDLELQPVVINGRPAVVADGRSMGSLSLTELVELGVDPVGITVKTHSGPRGEITAATPLGGQESPARKRLLGLSRVEANREAIRKAPDSELVCTVATGPDPAPAFDWVSSKLSVYDVPKEIVAGNPAVKEAMLLAARAAKERTRPNSEEKKAMLDAFLKRLCSPDGTGLPGGGPLLVPVSNDADVASEDGVGELLWWVDLHGPQRVLGGGATVPVNEHDESRVFDALKSHGIYKARALPKTADALATLLAVGDQEEARVAGGAALLVAEEVHQVLSNAAAVNGLLRGVASDMLLSTSTMRETVRQLKHRGAGAVLCFSTYPSGSTQEQALQKLLNQACRDFDMAPHLLSLGDVCKKDAGTWECLPLGDIKPRLLDAVCSLCTGLGHVPWSLSPGFEFADHVVRFKVRPLPWQENGWQDEVHVVVVPRGGEARAFKQADLAGADFEAQLNNFLEEAVLEGAVKVAIVFDGRPREKDELALKAFLAKRNARATFVEVVEQQLYQVFGMDSGGTSHLREEHVDLGVTLGPEESLLQTTAGAFPLLLRMGENDLGLTLEQGKILVSWTRRLCA